MKICRDNTGMYVYTIHTSIIMTEGLEMTEGLDKAIAIIKKKAKIPELTYSFIMDCLKGYKNPRDKIKHLINSRAIIRLKKGIYLLSQTHAQVLYSKELLANLIYGPSYVSLEYALSYYQLIPEYTTQVTSVCFKRSNTFDTPLGSFKYKKGCLKRYPIGVSLGSLSPEQNYLIATPEKALADTLVIERRVSRSLKSLKFILFDDLRIEPEDLFNLDISIFKEINEVSPHKSLELTIKLMEQK